MLTVQRSANFYLCRFRCGPPLIALTQEHCSYTRTNRKRLWS